MEFEELIHERRSVRRYQAGVTIPRSVLEEILSDTLQAPSWKNMESGRYYIIDDPARMAEFNDTVLPRMNQARCVNAAAFIVTTFVNGLSGYADGEPTRDNVSEWGAYDLGLQNAYLVLSARSHGYDTLIMGIRDEGKIRSLLSVPEEESILAVIAIGVRNEVPVYRERKSVSEIVKYK